MLCNQYATGMFPFTPALTKFTLRCIGTENPTADVCASAKGNVQVKVISRAAGVLPKEALCICLVQGPLQRHALIVVLTPAARQSSLSCI